MRCDAFGETLHLVEVAEGDPLIQTLVSVAGLGQQGVHLLQTVVERALFSL